MVSELLMTARRAGPIATSDHNRSVVDAESFFVTQHCEPDIPLILTSTGEHLLPRGRL